MIDLGKRKKKWLTMPDDRRLGAASESVAQERGIIT